MKAKFDTALIQMAQDSRQGRNKSGRSGKRGKEEREDRPNAVTLITLRGPRELRLCQLTIITYTRGPFLRRRSAPALWARNPTKGQLSLNVIMRK